MNETSLIAILFLIIISVILPFSQKEVYQKRELLLCYYTIFTVYEIVAISNVFIFTLPTATIDAQAFRDTAAQLAISGDFYISVGSEFYKNLLGVIYYICGSSTFVGEQISVLMILMSSLLLVKVSNLVGLSKYSLPILIVFAFLPSMVLYTAVALREAYQIYFFLLSAYFSVKVISSKNVNIDLLYFALSSFAMGLFHHALMIYSFFFLFLILSMLFYFKISTMTTNKSIYKIAVIAIIVFGITSYLIYAFTTLDLIAATNYFSKHGFIEAISTYRNQVAEHGGRTVYNALFDGSSLLMTIISFTELYLKYLFTPFPWKINCLVDVYAFLEALSRMLLLYFSFVAWRKSEGMQGTIFSFFLILYFSLTFLWAVGTSSYGTAMRHHLITWWILVMLGVPVIVDKLKTLNLRLR